MTPKCKINRRNMRKIMKTKQIWMMMNNMKIKIMDNNNTNEFSKQNFQKVNDNATKQMKMP